MFDAVRGHLATVGPVHADVVAVGIFLKNPRKFAELRPMQRWVAMSFSLSRRARHRTITRRIIEYGTKFWHVANVRGPRISTTNSETCSPRYITLPGDEMMRRRSRDAGGQASSAARYSSRRRLSGHTPREVFEMTVYVVPVTRCVAVRNETPASIPSSATTPTSGRSQNPRPYQCRSIGVSLRASTRVSPMPVDTMRPANIEVHNDSMSDTLV